MGKVRYLTSEYYSVKCTSIPEEGRMRLPPAVADVTWPEAKPDNWVKRFERSTTWGDDPYRDRLDHCMTYACSHCSRRAYMRTGMPKRRMVRMSI